MKAGFILNPVDEYVTIIRQKIRDNGGYCIHADKNNKKNKCPKYCKSLPTCPCDMYIKENEAV